MVHERILSFGSLGLLLLAVMLLLFHAHTNRQLIPPSIAKKISFVVVWPNDDVSIPDKQSIKFDAQAGVISFIVNIDTVKVTVDEQATPSEFTDIPDYYTTLINHMGNCDTFDSANGTVYLTRPSNTAGGEVAVNNHSGTLLFAHAEGDVSTSTWRLFFNNLKVVEN